MPQEKLTGAPLWGLLNRNYIGCFSLVAMLKTDAPGGYPEPCFPLGGEI